MGPAESHLEHGLVKLYWDGVENEVPGLLHLLSQHQHKEASPETRIEDGEAAAPEGEATQQSADEVLATGEDAVEGAGSQPNPFATGHETIALRTRARMLLRASEWLDIDKVVEDHEHAAETQDQGASSPGPSHGRAGKRTKKRPSRGRRLFERMRRVRYSVIRSTYGGSRSPYSRMHMALRIGTVMFENGVAHTDGGVVISNRPSPHPDQAGLRSFDNTRALLLAGKKRRLVFSQSRHSKQNRNRTTMKQVSGNDFRGLFDAQNENKVVDALIKESLNVKDSCTGSACSCEREKIYAGTIRIVNELKRYLGPRVGLYMSTVAGRLLDPSVRLAWHPDRNSCQAFCESLIDSSIFRLSFSPHEPAVNLGGAGSAALNPFVDNSDRLKEVTRDSRLDTAGGFAEFLSTITPDSRRGSEANQAMEQLAHKETKNLSIHLNPPARAGTGKRTSMHELLSQ